MPIDLTKIKNALQPDPKGENPNLQLRTAVVFTNNGDGTVDLILSGALVPDVPLLEGFNPANDATVQVLSARGILLVLGGVATTAAPEKAFALAPTSVQTASSGYTSFAGSDILGVVFAAPSSGQVEITMQGWLGVTNGSAAARAWLGTQVRQGAIINTGTVVEVAADAQAAVSQNAITTGFDYRYVNIAHVLTGLIPGSVYNITSVARTTGTNCATQDRRLSVKPF